MTKKPFVTLMLVAVLSVGLVCIAAAQDKQDAANRSEKAAGASAEPSGAMSQLALALQLADWGRANKSAEALIAAAQILQGVPLQERERERVAPQEGTADKQAAPVASVESLLAEAAALAGDDAALKQRIEAMRAAKPEAPVSKGRTAGPGISSTCVLANSTDIFIDTFRAGEQAVVIVDGDGDTDLDTYVYDENGNLIDSDDDYTDYCILSWTPRWTGAFRIEVKNLGNIANCYTLSTN